MTKRKEMTGRKPLEQRQSFLDLLELRRGRRGIRMLAIPSSSTSINALASVYHGISSLLCTTVVLKTDFTQAKVPLDRGRDTPHRAEVRA